LQPRHALETKAQTLQGHFKQQRPRRARLAFSVRSTDW